MTGGVTTAEEVEMRKKMVVPLFGVTELKNSTISKKFNPLFSPEMKLVNTLIPEKEAINHFQKMS